MARIVLVLLGLLALCVGCVAEVAMVQAPTQGHYYVIERQVGYFSDGRSDIKEYKVKEDGTFEFVREVK